MMDAESLERALGDAFRRHLASPQGDCPDNLAQAMSYSLLAPGKRIRPRLLLVCAEMVGLPVSAALPPALALEMIHCFTLIHDDLPCMDDDDFRRGRPSNHRQFGEGRSPCSLATDSWRLPWTCSWTRRRRFLLLDSRVG